jgi:hypothetical protein
VGEHVVGASGHDIKLLDKDSGKAMIRHTMNGCTNCILDGANGTFNLRDVIVG